MRIRTFGFPAAVAIVILALAATQVLAADCSCSRSEFQTNEPGSSNTGMLTTVSQSTSSPLGPTCDISQSGFCSVHGYVPTGTNVVAASERNPTALFTELRQQHRQVAALMQQILNARSADQPALYNQFRMAVIPHMKAEEATLYTALEQPARTHMRALMAEEEHHAAANVLGELDATPVNNDRWIARFSVLQDMILHHVNEEEGKVFPAAAAALTADQLRMLYAQFNEQQQSIAANLPPLQITASYVNPSGLSTGSPYDFNNPNYNSTLQSTGSQSMDFQQHMDASRWNGFNNSGQSMQQ